MKITGILFILFLLCLPNISCGDANDFIQDIIIVPDINTNNNSKTMTVKRIGDGLFPSTGAQGLAIYGNYLFRLYQYGYCYVYDISNIENILFINSFKLGSYANNNHPNCAQFAPAPPLEDTGFPLLYTTLGNNNEQMAIEKVSLEGSVCLKRITITDYDGKTSSHTRGNWIIGDDGFIWGMTQSGTPGNTDYTIHFYKLDIPLSEDKAQTISIANAVDHFIDDDSANLPVTWQGGMVRNGKLYFLFGTKKVKRELRIYDTNTHQRLAIVDLNKITSAEPEDIDLWQDDSIILGLNTVDHALLLKMIEK